MSKSVEQRLSDIENEIRENTTQERIYTNQLEELRPQRLKYEEQSQAEFGVPITELPKLLEKYEADLAAQVEAMEIKLAETKTVGEASGQI